MLITHLRIKKFIEQLGWKHSKTIRYGAMIFSKENISETILLPVDKKLSDYSFMINKAIDCLCSIMSIDKNLLKEKILFLDYDIVRFRLDTPLAKYGTLPLEIWIKHYELTVSSVKAAAQNIIKHTSRLSKFTSHQAADFANSCKIGQTEIGSYITKAIIPLGEHQVVLPMPDGINTSLASKPHGRQLSISLMQGINIIGKASHELESTSSMPILTKLSENRTMANLVKRLCSSYEEIVELSKKNANLYINIEASNSLPLDDEIKLYHHKIESRFIDHVKEINKVISKDYLPQINSFNGFITKLEKDTSNPDEKFGKVTLFTGDDKKINMILGDELYKIALKAHENRQPIAVKGILSHRKRRWHLDNVDDIILFSR
jgi:hypothetical protein